MMKAYHYDSYEQSAPPPVAAATAKKQPPKKDKADEELCAAHALLGLSPHMDPTQEGAASEGEDHMAEVFRLMNQEEKTSGHDESHLSPKSVVVSGAPTVLNLPSLPSSNSSSASTVTVPSCDVSLDGGIENHGWTVVCSSSTISNSNSNSVVVNAPVPSMIAEHATVETKKKPPIIVSANGTVVTTKFQKVHNEKKNHFCNYGNEYMMMMVPTALMDLDTMMIEKTNSPFAMSMERLAPTPSMTFAAIPTTLAAQPATFYEGSVSLHLPGDEESLSALHCFMRKYCVEAFSASAEDVATPRYGKSHGRSIVVGQVGIQCKHCKHRPYAQRQERAVCFPSSLKNIYHSIETWQRRHSLVCEDIPVWAKKSMTDLMGKSRSGAGGRRQYWEESAKRLGLADTDHGIRFVRPPGLPPAVATREPQAENVAEAVRSSNGVPEVLAPSQRPSLPVVAEDDKLLVTEYLFTLLDQMETCYFAEQDRVGGRSKVKDCEIGYPGLQCKHCSGKAGFGRYFPISLAALTSANSDRNIFNHIIKCRRCPVEVRDNLQHLLQQQHVLKNRRGSRKLFFMKVWARMHYKKLPAVCPRIDDTSAESATVAL